MLGGRGTRGQREQNEPLQERGCWVWGLHMPGVGFGSGLEESGERTGGGDEKGKQGQVGRGLGERGVVEEAGEVTRSFAGGGSG